MPFSRQEVQSVHLLCVHLHSTYRLLNDFSCSGTINAKHEFAAKAMESASITMWLYMVPSAPALLQLHMAEHL